MTVKPERRTVTASKILATAPKLERAELVKWLLDRTWISRATAYRLVKNKLEKDHVHRRQTTD